MNKYPNIGVIGNNIKLPHEFPILMPENAGNIIHGNAPLLILKNTAHYTEDKFKLSGHDSFVNFVNETCSHLILTMANTLIINSDQKKQSYRDLRLSLAQYKVPIIVFGLGIQSQTFINNAKLDEEAIQLLQFLSDRCNLLAVRGEYTKEIIENNTHRNNIHVVGCPSIYSSPNNLIKLKYINLNNGRASFSVTNLQRFEERKILLEGVQNENFMIEPVSSITHKYAVACLQNKDNEIPYYWNKIFKEHNLKFDITHIKDYYVKFYRLFRDLDTWLNFNLENVAYTYGTRFHVNVASILSGKPALWITHDTRTKELVDYHCLPSIDIKELSTNNRDLIESRLDYTIFFQNLKTNFNNFNYYLNKNGLVDKKRTAFDINNIL